METQDSFNGSTATVVLVAWLPDGRLLLIDHGDEAPCKHSLIEAALKPNEDWRDGMARTLFEVARVKLDPKRLVPVDVLTKSGVAIICTVRFFADDRDDFVQQGERPSRMSLWPTALPECVLPPLHRTAYDLVVAKYRTTSAGGNGYRGS